MKRYRKRCWTRAAMAACIVGLVFPAKSTAADRADLCFQRVFAPADRIDQWPLDGGRYVPLAAEEFERLADLVERGELGTATTARARVTRTSGVATVEGEWLRGQVTLQVERTGSLLALLALDPWAPAVVRAAWRDAPESDVLLGSTSGGRIALIVERDGALDVEFRMRGRQLAGGAHEFGLPSLGAATATWQVQLDADDPWDVTGGLATALEMESDRQTIAIDAAPTKLVRLLVRAGDETSHARHTVAAMQETTYEFSTSGVEVTAEFHLTLASTSPRQLAVTLDQGLVPLAAAWGEAPIEWQSQPGKDGGLELVLPVPHRNGVVPPLRITAWSPLRAQRRWSLPRVSIPDDEWRDGTVQLVTQEPLELVRLFSTPGARQTKSPRLTAPLSGESHTLQCLSPHGRIDVWLDVLAPRVSAVSGTTLDIDERETIATVAYDLRAESGEVFSLTGQVQPGWLIDNVGALPADQTFEPELEPAEAGRDVVKIRLRRPLNARSSLRLQVQARRNTQQGDVPLSLAMLEPVHWGGVATTRRLVSLHAARQGGLQWEAGDGPRPLSRDELTAAENDLLPSGDEEALFAWDDEENAGIILARGHRNVRAELTAEFRLAPRSVNEYYSLQCAPDEAPIDSLTVRFSHARRATLAWNSGSVATVDAERVVDSPPADGDAPAGELWNVRLWPPQTAPFTLTCQRESPHEGTTPLSLIHVANADVAAGRARVICDVQHFIEVNSDGPRATPASLSTDRGQDLTSAEFDYDPARDVERVSPPALQASIRDRTDDEVVPIVWNEAILTNVSSSGAWLHEARYSVELRGSPEFRLRLPRQARLMRVSSGGGALSHAIRGDRLAVALQHAVARQEVLIEYSTPEPHSASGDAPALFPRPERASVARTWRVRMPSSWDLLDVSLPWISLPQAAPTWRQRLFGPLARDATDAPFRPWRAETWSWHRGSSAGGSEGSRSQRGYVITGPSEGEPIVTWRTQDAGVRSFALAAIAVSALAWRLGRRRAAWRLALPFAAAAVALASPFQYAPVASGAFLGAMVGGLIAFTQAAARYVAEHGEPRQRKAGSTTRAAIAAGAHGALLATIVWSARAAEVRPQELAAARPPAQRVFIPVDGKRQRTGGRYYAPIELVGALRKRAAELGDESPQWLLTAGRHALGTSGRVLGPGDLLHSVYDLHVFERNVTVALSGPRSLAAVQEARLDGVAVDFGWSETAGGFCLEVAEPGPHQFELVLRPTTDPLDPATLRLPVLPVPSAELTVSGTAEQMAVVSCDAAPPPRGEAGTARLFTELGPIDEFVVRLPPSSNTESRPPSRATIELDQLLWLRLTPAGARLDVQHQLVTAAQPLDRLELSIDPLWRLGPESRSEEGQVRWSEAVAGRLIAKFLSPATVGARAVFHCERVAGAGVGEIAFPTVTPRDIVIRRRWCAISVDPALEVTSLANSQAGGMSAAQFAAAWGHDQETPQLVFAWPVPAPPPNVQTALLAPLTTADERLSIELRDGRADVRFEASAETLKSPVFSHRLRAPRDLEIEDVAVEQDGAKQVLRWARDDEGGVNVFLSAPVLGTHLLTLRGTVPLPKDESIELPMIGLEADSIAGRRLSLYRRSDVLVDEITPPPRPTAGPNDMMNSRTERRLVGEWTLPQSSEPVRLQLRPNLPHTSGLCIASLHPGQSAWTVQLALQLDVADGAIDALRFRIPETWPGPFTLEPAWSFEVVETPGDKDRTLVVRPPSLIDRAATLSVHAPLAIAANQAIQLPAVRLLTPGSVRQVVVLPVREGERPLGWDLRGLRTTRLPTTFESQHRDASAWRAYEAASDDFAAELQEPSPGGGQPAVVRAAYRVRSEVDGSYRATAALLFLPGGITHLPLRLPANSQLVDCRVMDSSALPIRTAAGGLLAPLQSDQLPQCVTITYGGQIGVRQSTLELGVSVPGVPTAETVWSISAPRGTIAQPTGDTAAAALEVVVDGYRVSLDQLAAGLSSPASGNNSIGPDSAVSRWLQAYAGTVRDARNVAVRTAETIADRAQSRRALATIGKVDAELANLIAKYAGLIDPLSANPSPADSDTARGVVLGGDEDGRTVMHLAAAAGSPAIDLPRPHSPDLAGPARYALAIGLAALAIWMVRRTQSPTWLASALRRRWIVYAIAGVAWWLWLSPSAVGALISAIALASAMRTRWVERAATASTILQRALH